MIMNPKYAERIPSYKNGIHCLLLLVLTSGCATAYENIRRVRRLDCEQHRKEAQTQYQGKEINYDALNVTRLFKGDKEKEKKPILQDRALNEVCYIRINDLVFAKRGPESACQKK